MTASGQPIPVVILLAILSLGLGAGDAAKPTRYPIAPGRIRHELGHCYIADMDFGEEGDKFTDNGSQLVVYEDGEHLGPAHSLHRDIRQEGRGRYSHWTREALYFSASDNSDPRKNGRKYEVASDNPVSMLGGIAALPCTEHEHVEHIETSMHEYSIEMGGTLDMENTLTVAHGNYRVAFQPNIQLTIENVGDAPVVNPRLVINDRGNWYTFESLLEEFTRGAGSDQDRVYLIWQNMRRNLYHETPLFANNVPHDPVRLMNIFGFNLCDDAGNAGCSLYHHGGFPGSKNRALHGHVQCEALLDGEFQFMDIDMDCFYLDRENERPVSGDAIAHDHDLARRELNYGPVVGEFKPSDAPAALFGDDDGEAFPKLRGHEIAYTLRPGERTEFRWDNIGKICAQSEKWRHIPKYFGNSKFIFEPRLTEERMEADAVSVTDIVPSAEGGARIADGRSDAAIVYRTRVPYCIVGGTVRAEFTGRHAGDRCSIGLSLDGAEFTDLWAGADQHEAEVALDEALDVLNDPPKYEYFVRAGLESADGQPGPVLRSLAIETDVMAAPQSLPRLQLGTNACAYTDETDGPHSVRVTHEWRETDAITPLAPPKPVRPAAGRAVGRGFIPRQPLPSAQVRQSIVEYEWKPVDGASKYHLQVSRRNDFAWPYRPSLDVIIPRTSWRVPFTGIYSPGVTYHWRLRSQDRYGVWGPWGDARTFTWRGPCVPVDVHLERDGRTFTLHWKPNPRGERPLRYAVFGSDEKGFTARREAHNSWKRGDAGPNFIAETAKTSMVVIGPQAKGENMNRVFYRVVAIDADGVESGNSDYAEAPHPFIYTDPVTEAKVGQEYRYDVKSLRSIGDCQNRPKPEEGGYRYGFWDIEENAFALRDAPHWLHINAESGVVSGTPGADDVGQATVSAAVTNQFGGRADQDFSLVVRG